jgi:hypothetical protein
MMRCLHVSTRYECPDSMTLHGYKDIGGSKKSELQRPVTARRIRTEQLLKRPNELLGELGLGLEPRAIQHVLL